MQDNKKEKYIITFEEIINACDKIIEDIGGVDKDGSPLKVDGFIYGTVDACYKIVKHFKKLTNKNNQ